MRERRRNEIIHIYVSLVFIHVYGDDAMQQFLISLSNAEISCFAPLKTMKGGKFVPSASAIRQIETRIFLCPIVFTVTVFLSVSSTVASETKSAQMGFHP